MKLIALLLSLLVSHHAAAVKEPTAPSKVRCAVAVGTPYGSWAVCGNSIPPKPPTIAGCKWYATNYGGVTAEIACVKEFAPIRFGR